MKFSDVSLEGWYYLEIASTVMPYICQTVDLLSDVLIISQSMYILHTYVQNFRNLFINVFLDSFFFLKLMNFSGLFKFLITAHKSVHT